MEPLYRPSQQELDEQHREALAALRPHTLPADAPGAWARAAIDRAAGE